MPNVPPPSLPVATNVASAAGSTSFQSNQLILKNGTSPRMLTLTSLNGAFVSPPVTVKNAPFWKFHIIVFK